MPAAEALDSLKNKTFLQRCELLLDTAIRTSQRMAMEGFGAVRTISMDFRSGGGLRITSLTVGDEWGEPGMASIILELSTGVRMVRSAKEPVIWMASETYEGLRVYSEFFDLRLTTGSHQSLHVVICEALPWTS